MESQGQRLRELGANSGSEGSQTVDLVKGLHEPVSRKQAEGKELGALSVKNVCAE